MRMTNEKTYSEVNTEIEQHIAALHSLEASANKHRDQLRAMLGTRAKIEKGLGVLASASRRGQSRRTQDKEKRDWLIANGHRQPGDRGRLTNEQHAAFAAARPAN